MRILIVTGIFPPDIGGPATYVPAVGKFLVSSGHEVSVLTLSERAVRDDEYPFPVTRIPRSQNKLARTLQTIIGILRLSKQADLVYVNGLAFECATANLILKRPLVLKIVGDWAWERAMLRNWTESDFDQFQEEIGDFKLRFLKRLRNWWSKSADLIIVPSQYLADCAASWGVPECHIRVIYNSFEPAASVQPGTIPLATKTNLVTAGRLVPWKRIDGIIRNLKRLTDTGLVIVGGGPEEGKLKLLTRRLGLEPRVYFAGLRSKQETLSLMASCQIFVLNSTYEGLPHVVLEAMSLSLPVIATAAGGTLEVIQDRRNGLLVPLNGADCLQGAICDLLNDDTFARSLVANARNDLERFTSQPIHLLTEKILSGVVH